MIDHDVIVVGAGQAGLATGRALQARGLNFTILDAASEVGGSWSNYYDSLQLFSPARYSALPDLPLPGDPWRYPSGHEITAYLKEYQGHFALPVELGIAVNSARFADNQYRLSLADGLVRTARSLIVATGGFSTPWMPTLPGQDQFAGKVLHAGDYRNPGPFAGKQVVIVGAGNSAVQIAVELAEKADVTLAVRDRIRYLPQRVLGQDVHWWFDKLRLNGRNLFSDHGVPVIDGGRYRDALRRKAPPVRQMFKRFAQTGLIWDEGTAAEPVDVVIFATGYRPVLGLLDGSGALDAKGQPLHRRGVSTSLPRLGYVGLSGQSGFASATLRGVGPDAAHVVPAVTGP
jgi:putative flavoprotein involved in K+ transport